MRLPSIGHPGLPMHRRSETGSGVTGSLPPTLDEMRTETSLASVPSSRRCSRLPAGKVGGMGGGCGVWRVHGRGCAWDESSSASASLTTIRRDDPHLPASQGSREAQVGKHVRACSQALKGSAHVRRWYYCRKSSK